MSRRRSREEMFPQLARVFRRMTPLGPYGQELPNYISTNGARPYQVGLSKSQALFPLFWETTDNNASATPMIYGRGAAKRFPNIPSNANGKRVITKFQFTVTDYLFTP